MIRLKKVSKPARLTQSNVKLWTDQFKATGKSVWRKKSIRQALLEMGRNKCAYCECRLEEESKYLEAEHFKYKQKYLDDVLRWKNLLPACRRCNLEKGEHDVVEFPIVNPRFQNPSDDIAIKIVYDGDECFCRMIGTSEKGQSTIKTLNLLDAERITKPRNGVATRIVRKLNDLHHIAEIAIKAGQTTHDLNVLKNGLHHLLQEAQPESEYAAIAASVLLYDGRYASIRGFLEGQNEFPVELNAKENRARRCLLPKSL
jgi:uncharacterized protein (TIGR02646 family)